MADPFDEDSTPSRPLPVSSPGKTPTTPGPLSPKMLDGKLVASTSSAALMDEDDPFTPTPSNHRRPANPDDTSSSSPTNSSNNSSRRPSTDSSASSSVDTPERDARRRKILKKTSSAPDVTDENLSALHSHIDPHADNERDFRTPRANASGSSSFASPPPSVNGTTVTYKLPRNVSDELEEMLLTDSDEEDKVVVKSSFGLFKNADEKALLAIEDREEAFRRYLEDKRKSQFKDMRTRVKLFTADVNRMVVAQFKAKMALNEEELSERKMLQKNFSSALSKVHMDERNDKIAVEKAVKAAAKINAPA